MPLFLILLYRTPAAFARRKKKNIWTKLRFHIDRTGIESYNKEKRREKKGGKTKMESYFGKGNRCSDRVSERYLAVNNCGYYRKINVDMRTFRAEGRRDFQYLYIDRGKGTFVLDREERTLGAGTVILFLPNERQEYTFFADGETDYYWVHFTGTGAYELLSRAGLRGGVFEAGELFSVREAVRRMVRLFRSETETAEVYSEGLLTEILCETGMRVDGGRFVMQKVIEKMQKDGAAGRRNAEYAALCGMSEYHFIRRFKEETGKTPLRYRMGLVIERACDLFSKTEMNIAEAAYFLGFDDPLYFSRVFKKETGLSPREFREKNRGG